MLPSRVSILKEHELRPEQRALLDSIRQGPRGAGITIRGPFAVFLHAPAFGELAQQLGGYCRFKTAVPPRLSEFAILATAKLWIEVLAGLVGLIGALLALFGLLRN